MRRAAWLLLGIALPSVGAAEESREPRPYWRTSVFRRAVTDQKYLFVSWLPSEARNPRFVVPLATAALVAGAADPSTASGLDIELARSLRERSTSRTHSAANAVTTLGNPGVLIAFVGIGYLSARHAGNDRFAATASLAAEAGLDAALWEFILKRAFARIRPDNPDEGRFFRYSASENNSMPSGHATGVFAVATVFAESYRDIRWVPWFAYGTAAAVALSRVSLGSHFPADVVAGGALGASLGRMVVSRSRGVDGAMPETQRAWRLVPLVDAEREGIGVAWVWER